MTREDLMIGGPHGRCAAWLYRPPASDGRAVPCVVIGAGLSLTRHDGLTAYAERFAAAGAAVMLFDYRHRTTSHNGPQRFGFRGQLDDWRSAIAYARAWGGLDPNRVVVWGYSLTAGAVVKLATEDSGIVAAMVLSPFLDGLARTRRSPLRNTAWIARRALVDLLGRTTTIPVAAQPGQRGAMVLPGEADGFRRVVPHRSPWRNEMPAAAAVIAIGHRRQTAARRVRCPLWVGIGEKDHSVSSTAAEYLASRAPEAELQRYAFDHFAPLVGAAPELVATDQIRFLRQRGVLTRDRAATEIAPSS